MFLEFLASFGQGAGSVENELALDRLVRDLNGESNHDYPTYNVFSSRIKALYPYIGGTSFTHSINLIDPAQFAITWYGSPTHSANGVTFSGAGQFGDTGLNCRTHLGLYNKSGGMYASDIGPGNTALWGAFDFVGFFGVRHSESLEVTGLGVNSFQEISPGPIVPHFAVVEVTDASTAKLFNEGVKSNTLVPGGTDPDANIIVGGISHFHLAASTAKLLYVGSAMSEAEHLGIANAVNAYQAALNRAL
jgi:hypothetical protein